ncbi:hypothetical protein NPIL_179591 [Nephila pilipes]|uniref:Uncharacterized protein n=1 Tax=Nephila pilipes TaxID=299642 RepID=A0A8X6MYR0_NEPPI|nr:hypothetical protein NPIL_179591 [Nephila pilipes]
MRNVPIIISLAPGPPLSPNKNKISELLSSSYERKRIAAAFISSCGSAGLTNRPILRRHFAHNESSDNNSFQREVLVVIGV